MVKFLKWLALYKLGCCLSRRVSMVTSLRLARYPNATKNTTLLPSVAHTWKPRFAQPVL